MGRAPERASTTGIKENAVVAVMVAIMEPSLLHQDQLLCHRVRRSQLLHSIAPTPIWVDTYRELPILHQHQQNRMSSSSRISCEKKRRHMAALARTKGLEYSLVTSPFT